MAETKKTRLFVDIDGTLAEFKVVDTLETLYEKGYFENLQPNMNVVDAVKEINAAHPEIEVYILSSVLTDSQYALEEKKNWLSKYLPEIPSERWIFPPCGEDKKDYIPDGVRPDDFLLDDYSANLTLWEPPAKGIKLFNGINGNNGTWTKNSLSILNSSHKLANKICGIVNNGIRYNERRPQEELIIRQNKKENKKFSKKIDAFLNNNLPNEQILIGKTPNALVLAGANPDLDITIAPKTIRKCISDQETVYHGHSLSPDIMKQIPNQLRNPVMILKGSKDNSLVIITDIEDSNKDSIIVAINIDAQNKRHKTNRISSIYGKYNIGNYLLKQIEKGNLIAINKNKANRMAQSLGLQLPPEESVISFNDSISYSLSNVKGFNKKNNEIISNNSPSGNLEPIIPQKIVNQSDIVALRSIEPRKSVLNFTAEEKAITRKWAERYASDIGKKSPFFRAESEWRDKEENTIPIILLSKNNTTYKVISEDIKNNVIYRGSAINDDTNWNIQISRKGLEDTLRYAYKHTDNIPYNMLYSISDIIKHGILLDTEIVDSKKKNKANDTAFMHKFYAICNSNEKNYLAKVSVEEFFNGDNKNPTTLKRLYNLQDITIEPLRNISLTENQLHSANHNNSEISISELFQVVKVYDKSFYLNKKNIKGNEVTTMATSFTREDLENMQRAVERMEYSQDDLNAFRYLEDNISSENYNGITENVQIFSYAYKRLQEYYSQNAAERPDINITLNKMEQIMSNERNSLNFDEQTNNAYILFSVEKNGEVFNYYTEETTSVPDLLKKYYETDGYIPALAEGSTPISDVRWAELEQGNRPPVFSATFNADENTFRLYSETMRSIDGNLSDILSVTALTNTALPLYTNPELKSAYNDFLYNTGVLNDTHLNFIELYGNLPAELNTVGTLNYIKEYCNAQLANEEQRASIIYMQTAITTYENSPEAAMTNEIIRLRTEMTAMQKQLNEQSKSINALNSFVAAITEAQDFERTMLEVESITRQVTECETATMYCYDRNENRFYTSNGDYRDWQNVQNPEELINAMDGNITVSGNKAIIPITSSKNQTLGVVVAEKSKGFKDIDFSMLEKGSQINNTIDLAINKELNHQLAVTDALTGMKNRDGLDEYIKSIMCSNLTNNEKSVNIAMIDIDHFKNINDTYGHDVGDIILRNVAKTVSEHTRLGEDCSFRIGGEEMVCIMNCSPVEAIEAAERLRAEIEKSVMHTVEHDGITEEIKVTISVGIHEMQTNELANPANINEIYSREYKKADQAVYTAKETGRNKVVSSNNEHMIKFIANKTAEAIFSNDDAVIQQHSQEIKEMLSNGNYSGVTDIIEAAIKNDSIDPNEAITALERINNYVSAVEYSQEISNIGSLNNAEEANMETQNAKYSEDGTELISVNKTVQEFIIPEGVTKIGSYAFENCRDLKSVKLPDTLTVIGYGAFKECTYLRDLNMSNNINKIDAFAFENCRDLKSVKLPDTLTVIGYGAFRDCVRLKDLNIPDSVKVIVDRAFENCPARLNNQNEVKIANAKNNTANNPSESDNFFNWNTFTETEYNTLVNAVRNKENIDVSPVLHPTDPKLSDYQIDINIKPLGSDDWALDCDVFVNDTDGIDGVGYYSPDLPDYNTFKKETESNCREIIENHQNKEKVHNTASKEITEKSPNKEKPATKKVIGNTKLDEIGAKEERAYRTVSSRHAYKLGKQLTSDGVKWTGYIKDNNKTTIVINKKDTKAYYNANETVKATYEEKKYKAVEIAEKNCENGAKEMDETKKTIESLNNIEDINRNSGTVR